MVWILIALMTGAAVLCVVWPLSKARGRTFAMTGDDLPFYRDQLRALDRDVAAGLVPASEAEGSRAEIGRRLIAAADRTATPAHASANRIRLLAIAAAVALLVPGLSLWLYLRVGAPQLPDLPLTARLAAPNPDDLGAAIARIETHLISHPTDGKGFSLLAPIYVRLGRYADAVRAYERTLVLLGETAERRAAYGEALTLQADGVVTAEARDAFQKALDDDPKSPQPRYFLGLAAEQDGDKPRAKALWTALVDESPEDAPWLPEVRARLAALDQAAPVKPATRLPAPTGEAAASIAALPAGQQLAAIHGMVDGLAARLQQNGQDKEGWLRLVRAYTVLGEKDKAASALADARRNLAADAAGLSQLDGLARELGLGGQG
ncbi:c-type cytochrome biogenesis protein CcmI [Lichenifustis flavocetrariae]|uniref:C-type cytochrome biogenesis protein CcmI n=1 Tax=Lichenifustis flavocetrariae TaxID=2949735 RepID=A0AA42CI71_9HYPH|nr:c-type cytochrome biogenesis protein CcmI [Lichenifustis flavocetrariae]MCW6506526.1 c-type cytochrome biogenesis protein CcmI [Lichenifustis flavocetrariae]